MKPVVIDCAAELAALEKTWEGARARSATHLTLMTNELAAARPIAPSGRRLRKSMEHSLWVLIELQSVAVGLMEGMMRLFRAQLEHQKECNNEERSPD